MNPLKQKMANGQLVVGLTIVELFRPSLVKLYANAGSDFLYIENEHGMLDPTSWADSLLCARDNNLPVIAKTPYLDRGAVVKFLDTGTIGDVHATIHFRQIVNYEMAQSRGEKELRNSWNYFPKPLHGFTLIELLVVISIITLLIALLRRRCKARGRADARQSV